MAILASDLKFLSSERMTDLASGSAIGGGYASGPVVMTGVSGNVFPAAMPADLVAGARQLRLLYPAVLSNENSLASNAQVAVYQRASDALVSIFAFSPLSFALGLAPLGVDARAWSRRRFNLDLALTQLAQALVNRRQLAGVDSVSATLTSAGGNSLSGIAVDLTGQLAVGGKVCVALGSTQANWRTVTAFNGPAGTLTFAGGGLTGVGAGTTVSVQAYGAPTIPVSAPAHLTAGVSSGAQEVAVDRLMVRVEPIGVSTLNPDTTVVGAVGDTASSWRTVAALGGALPAFYPGAAVLIDDPTNGTAPEVKVVESVNYLTSVVRFTTTLANAYTTGSRVSPLIGLGNLQARVDVPPFAQQAWSRVWADSLVGAPLAARYSGTIAMNNAGGITDRWAVVFSSATNFKLISERLGQIAAGNTASDFVPLNPLTSQPYFTLPAAGWGSGWLPGNVVRFNTVGAHEGAWYARVISPGAAGADEGGLIMRVDV